MSSLKELQTEEKVKITISIDGVNVDVPEGSTILDAARSININIPTLCHFEGLKPIGACRLCVVEVEGARTLSASCVTPVSPNMKVHTNSKRVRKARKLVMELLLSDHAGECLTCNRNGTCELQKLSNELGIESITYKGDKHRAIFDDTTPALIRDSSKCIRCRRCVTVCRNVQGVGSIFPQNRGFETFIGPAFGNSLETVTCVQCGQCAAVCPVGAIVEHDQIKKVWEAIDDPNKFVVVQTAPAIQAALGECFGYEPGTLVTGKIYSALRRMGFDAVFSTNFAADLTIMEEGSELLERIKQAFTEDKKDVLPLFTSCCPAWIQYAEYYYPELLHNISTCKSPQQMFGAASKTYFSKTIAKHPTDIVVVSVMPCTAKKYEAQRPEMDSSWTQDVDAVITTRELAQMIKQAGIDFRSLSDEGVDNYLGSYTGAADIFANTGGVMEAALRTTYEIITGSQLPFDNLHIKPIEGFQDIKEASITFDKTVPEWSFLQGETLNVAVVHGLENAKKVINMVKSGEKKYHVIEVMSCHGGCIGGAGQPRSKDKDILKHRMKAIYRKDETTTVRKSHENPEIKKAYEKFFSYPLSERAHKFLHTHYKTKKDSK